VACHGKALQGTGNVPSLVDGKLKGVTAGEVFWFITKGDKDNGMPAWDFLPEESRWQIVTYVQAMASGKAGASAASAPAAEVDTGKIKDASPTAPFTDFRYEAPGTTRKITPKDLPQPYATQSSNNGAELVARPDNAWPVAPSGFKVELFATGLNNPRLLRTAPNGDIFLAESDPGRIRVFRGNDRRRQTGAGAGFRQRAQAPVWHRVLSAGAGPAMDLYRQHKRGDSLPLPQWRYEGERRVAAYRRSAQRGRALDAGG
jgi:hypothetical protein